MVISSNSRDKSLIKNSSCQLGQTGLTGLGNRSNRLGADSTVLLAPHHVNLTPSLTNFLSLTPCSARPSRALPLPKALNPQSIISI